MFWVQNDYFVIVVTTTTFVIHSFKEVIHSFKEADADCKRKLIEDFGKSEAKIKTTKQDYVAGSIRKTRYFSKRKVIVAGNCQQPNENFK
ncbi:hypothetical protein Peur_028700 [Populus x canadensis]